MEFLIVPVIFATALFFLSIGKFFGKKEGVQTGCSAGKHIDASCGACSREDAKLQVNADDSGMENIARLGYPGRRKRFIDKLDFRPERF